MKYEFTNPSQEKKNVNLMMKTSIKPNDRQIKKKSYLLALFVK